jgi:hypothetical protein
MRKIYALTMLAFALAACGMPATHQANVSHTTPAVTAPPVSAPPAAPNPEGKYQGSCDYTLSSNIYGKDHLIGEIDIHNTGNIGTIDHVRITWPQEGYAPIVATRTVRTKPGEHLAVRFHIPVSSSGNVITQLQSWQESHGMRNGCTYKVTETGTFGIVQGG